MDNKKKQLYIIEDESGLELSLGLSCGNSSSDRRSSPDRPIDGKNNTNLWLDARRQAVEGMHLQSTLKMREFLPEVHSSQQQQIPWAQANSKPVEFGKFLGKTSQRSDHEEDKDHDSTDQKKFALHQEARKKRKMLIDEQKLQKKSKDDDKPGQDGAENSVIPPIHRVGSLGTFQNRGMEPSTASMAVLASQLMMRRTISDPTGGAGGQIPKEKEEGTGDGTKEETTDPVRAIENGIPDEAKHLLSMWQLGTTVDVPSAERINPELTNVQPTGHIGGSGTSPDLPWVSATGPGGKTISGVAYKLFQGQYKIVCSCHGLHMSPTDFVKHAGNLDGSVKGIAGDAIPVPV